MGQVQKKPDIDKKTNKYVVPVLITVIILLGLTTIFFGWQYWQLKTDKDQLQSQVDRLNSQIANNLKNFTNQTGPSPTPTAYSAITKIFIDNVAAAISSKNTAVLEGYMAPSVNVILAASEGIGPQTPVQAVNDLEYLNSATSPWDFSLASSKLAAYQSSQYYGKYFGDNTIVGKSANGYVVAFGVNASGKIDTIFMAVNEELLSQ